MKIYPLTALLLLAFSCKKQHLPEDESQPVFTFSGTFNGTQEVYQAGVDDYYMFSLFEYIDNSYYQFGGTLKADNCDNCPSISIKINDTQSRPENEPANINEIIMEQNYDYQSLQTLKDLSMTLQFISMASGKGELGHYWEFGDGATSTSKNPIHKFKNTFYNPVCLTVTDSDSCQSTVCNFVGPDTAYNDCNSRFNSKYLEQEGYYMFYPLGGEKQDAQYHWRFGDSKESEEAKPIHYYQNPGTYEVRLTVVNNYKNCISSYTKNISVPDPNSCAAAFNFKTITDSNFYSYSMATVEYRTKEGKLYSSNSSVAQPEQSLFKVIKSGEYKSNEHGHPTKKLELELNCTLYNTEDPTDQIILKNGKAVWAMAYPK